MLNIVIPMAGRGSRFVKAGYSDPKPFIDTGNGIPMIQRVVENLTPYQPYRFIFLARREHEGYIERHMSFATHVIYVDEVTEGAACTVLLAEEFIDNQCPLIIANSDQLIEWNGAEKLRSAGCHTGFGLSWPETNNLQDLINDASIRDLDASIATFYANHPKWSYAKLRHPKNFTSKVTEVAEKKVISNDATVGVYYFARGDTFVRGAHTMIRKNIRTNGEFYVCPVFNELVKNFNVGIYPVKAMDGLGTPEDLERYLAAR